MPFDDRELFANSNLYYLLYTKSCGLSSAHKPLALRKQNRNAHIVLERSCTPR
jgi:hypothetical protein